LCRDSFTPSTALFTRKERRGSGLLRRSIACSCIPTHEDAG